jgi:hypothetical protein|tara:strand:+ start:1741 stop:2094 length:354 start_codon:yes stop_codon:yes gene_type:complete
MGLYDRIAGGASTIANTGGNLYEGFKNEVGSFGNYVVDSASNIIVGGANTTGRIVGGAGATTGRVITDVSTPIVTIGQEAARLPGTIVGGVTAPVGQLGKDLTIPLIIGAAVLLLRK